MKPRTLAAILLALVLCAAVSAAALASPLDQAAGTKQVGLVIAFPDGSKYTGIVTVPADATTFDALQKANIQLVSVTQQFGPAICSINNTGCPATNCFCDKQHVWAFYHLDAANKKWTAAQEGVGTAKPANGAVEGLIWSAVDANFNPTDQPPVVTFDQIKAHAPTPAAQAGATPAAQPPAGLPTTGAASDNTYLLWLAAIAAALVVVGAAVSLPKRRG